MTPEEKSVAAIPGYFAVELLYLVSSALLIESTSALLLASRAFFWTPVKMVMPITDSMAIMEITTNSSTRVKPLEAGRNFFTFYYLC